MKRLLLATFFSLAILSLATPGLAWEARPRMRIREMLCNGNVLKPTVAFTSARGTVRFARLLDLRRSFLAELVESGQERVFEPSKRGPGTLGQD